MKQCTPKQAGQYLLREIARLQQNPGDTLEERLIAGDRLLTAMYRLFAEDELDTLRKKTWGYLRNQTQRDDQARSAIEWAQDWTANLGHDLDGAVEPETASVATELLKRDDENYLVPAAADDREAMLCWKYESEDAGADSGWFRTILHGFD